MINTNCSLPHSLGFRGFLRQHSAPARGSDCCCAIHPWTAKTEQCWDALLGEDARAGREITRNEEAKAPHQLFPLQSEDWPHCWQDWGWGGLRDNAKKDAEFPGIQGKEAELTGMLLDLTLVQSYTRPVCSEPHKGVSNPEGWPATSQK